MAAARLGNGHGDPLPRRSGAAIGVVITRLPVVASVPFANQSGMPLR